MIKTKRVRKPEPLPYPRPEGCSEIGAARAKELCGFRLSKYRAEEHEEYIDADDMHTLEGVVCELGREISKKRLRPASKNLRNAEYLISLILTSYSFSSDQESQTGLSSTSTRLSDRPGTLSAVVFLFLILCSSATLEHPAYCFVRHDSNHC